MKQFAHGILIVLAVALVGCVSTSKVVPMGKDSYMLTGSGIGGPGIGKSPIAATAKANVYCASQNKFMIVRHISTAPAYNREMTTLIFSCVDENDPEYQRPNLRKDPTTVIQDARSH